jgi:hypothetical protein
MCAAQVDEQLWPTRCFFSVLEPSQVLSLEGRAGNRLGRDNRYGTIHGLLSFSIEQVGYGSAYAAGRSRSK